MSGDGNPGKESPSCKRMARSMSSSDMSEVIFVSQKSMRKSFMMVPSWEKQSLID